MATRPPQLCLSAAPDRALHHSPSAQASPSAQLGLPSCSPVPAPAFLPGCPFSSPFPCHVILHFLPLNSDLFVRKGWSPFQDFNAWCISTPLSLSLHHHKSSPSPRKVDEQALPCFMLSYGLKSFRFFYFKVSQISTFKCYNPVFESIYFRSRPIWIPPFFSHLLTMLPRASSLSLLFLSLNEYKTSTSQGYSKEPVKIKWHKKSTYTVLTTE